jgi:hypothetical protein
LGLRVKLPARIILLVVLAIVGGSLTPALPAASRALPAPPGPDRYSKVVVPYVDFTWWVTAWENNDVVCDIVIDYEGQPLPPDIFQQCGETIYNDWFKTAPCPDDIITNDPADCSGYYMQFAGSETKEKTIGTSLPPPQVWIDLENCNQRPDGGCSTRPTLILRGEEPLPNEKITSIAGKIGSSSFECGGAACPFSLYVTRPEGVQMEFWAFSTYGDSSQTFTALIRVAAIMPESGDQPIWYVTVLSSQWIGMPIASCAETWDAFPPAGPMPIWLTTPRTAPELASDVPYTYLAGNLITKGFVDASSCPDGGLTLGGAANVCGMETARAMVTEWQNRFDALIINESNKTGVPAVLLKNTFSRESQFWPGVFMDGEDVGFGQLTENGADTTLLWNPAFYNQFCPYVLSERTCSKGYAILKSSEQAMLRGALVSSVDATCDNCPTGVDLTKADFSVDVFAQTMLANCEQAGRIVQELSGQTPGRVTTYEDMWKFTLVNYNAGAGCLFNSVKETLLSGLDLSWENLSSKLPENCQGAVDYVGDITQ